jgi:hypothetical protein
MSTLYLKKLSGEVIPLYLSDAALLYPAVRELGVDPGYTFQLFSLDGEKLNATPRDGETLLVLYRPVKKIDARIVCLQQAIIESSESDNYYNKFMMEITGIDEHEKRVVFTHRVNFYTQGWADIGSMSDRVFIPEDSMRILNQDAEVEKAEQIGRAYDRIEGMTENFVPVEYPEELRFRMKKKLNKIWNGTMFLY